MDGERDTPPLKPVILEPRARAARPVPEDYGLTLEDLRIWYAPGRAGMILAVLLTVGTALTEALDRAHGGWFAGIIAGLLYGGLLGGFGGLGVLVLLHWLDPLLGRLWPTYGRLRRYRDALAAARRASGEPAT